MTKCPTCGLWVNKELQICPRCGAMLTEITFSDTPAAATVEMRKSGSQLVRWDMHPTAPVFEAPEEPTDAGSPPDVTAPPSEAPEPARRRPPWIRVLFLLAFFLYPIISSFVRSWSSFREQSSPPVLREVVISESAMEGVPLQPRTDFSLQKYREIEVFSRWTGRSEGHGFALVWIEPRQEGTTERITRNGATPIVRREQNNVGFSVSGELPLDPAMPEGEWEVRILLDGQLRGSSKFVVRK